MSSAVDIDRSSGLYMGAQMQWVSREIDRQIAPGAGIPTHIPVLDERVAIGYDMNKTPESMWKPTAVIHVATDAEVSRVTLNDFKAPHGFFNRYRPFQPISLKFNDTAPPENPVEAPFDALVGVATVSGELSVRGLIGVDEVELTQFTHDEAFDFIGVCLKTARDFLPVPNPAGNPRP